MLHRERKEGRGRKGRRKRREGGTCKYMFIKKHTCMQECIQIVGI